MGNLYIRTQILSYVTIRVKRTEIKYSGQSDLIAKYVFAYAHIPINSVFCIFASIQDKNLTAYAKRN